MSQYLDTLKVGDTVDIRGPAGKLTYLGRGKVHSFPLVVRQYAELRVYYSPV